jgi:hypothetical protein
MHNIVSYMNAQNTHPNNGSAQYCNCKLCDGAPFVNISNVNSKISQLYQNYGYFSLWNVEMQDFFLDFPI